MDNVKYKIYKVKYSRKLEEKCYLNHHSNVSFKLLETSIMFQSRFKINI